MRLALTLVNGDVLLGEEAEIQRLLRFTSGFAVEQGGVDVTRRQTTAAGVEETQQVARWVNQAEVILIAEEPDA